MRYFCVRMSVGTLLNVVNIRQWENHFETCLIGRNIEFRGKPLIYKSDALDLSQTYAGSYTLYEHTLDLTFPRSLNFKTHENIPPRTIWFRQEHYKNLNILKLQSQIILEFPVDLNSNLYYFIKKLRFCAYNTPCFGGYNSFMDDLMRSRIYYDERGIFHLEFFPDRKLYRKYFSASLLV